MFKEMLTHNKKQELRDKGQ